MKRTWLPRAATALLLLPLAASARAQAVVRIDTGVVEGEQVDEASKLRIFRGIPYAAPPVGALRWCPPRAAAAWEGTRPAVEFGKACPQSPLIAFLSGETLPATSEDCLTVNVWTAAPNSDARQPVLVWIHGGGFVGGWADQKLYEGAPFAAQGIVFVSLNYRLGPLGFFAHPELSEESEHEVSGNYGLLDQIAALRWVQRNIAAFGGDPAHVTIFGESAGATSVLALCASPLSAGLFHGAIAQSTWVADNFTPLAGAEEQGIGFAEILVTDPERRSLAALRALPPDRLWQTLGQRFQPTAVVDGWALTAPPEDVFAAGAQHDVPLITGTTADEGTAFLALFPDATAAAFRKRIEERFGAGSEDVLALYPVAKDADVPAQISRMITDDWFVRGTRAMLNGMGQVESRAWQYVFTRANPKMPALGAHHAVELPHVFAAVEESAPDADRELSRAMFGYWVNFAKTGDPNGAGLPSWPAWEPDDEAYLVLGTPIATDKAYRKEPCFVLDALRAERRSEARER